MSPPTHQVASGNPHRLTLGSVWFSPVKLGWKLVSGNTSPGGWSSGKPGQIAMEGLIWLVRCWKLEKSQIWCWMTFNFSWLRWYLNSTYHPKRTPFEYCELQHRNKNSEAQIPKKRKKKLLFWQIIQLLKKKTLEMYIYLKKYISLDSTVLLSCFFCRKKCIKTARCFCSKSNPSTPCFMAPYSSHGVSTPTTTPTPEPPSGRLDFRALAWQFIIW